LEFPVFDTQEKQVRVTLDGQAFIKATGVFFVKRKESRLSKGEE
jgi:hypothetical protein